MRGTIDRKTVIRIAGLGVSLVGLIVTGGALLRFMRSVAANTVEGSASLLRNPEYYLRIGAYYSRGFTAGFFACYFLMLIAILAGSWVDEVRRTRRAARAIAPAPPATRPALAGAPATPE